MSQTPRARTGNSVGRFCRDLWSTLNNYDSNLSMLGTLLKKNPLFRIFVNYCQSKKRPTIWIWMQLPQGIVSRYMFFEWVINTRFYYTKKARSQADMMNWRASSKPFEIWGVLAKKNCTNWKCTKSSHPPKDGIIALRSATNGSISDF